MSIRAGKVYCIGETVLDIIFQDDLPLAAKPGGSMLNSAVSLGRAGISVTFISDFAHDHAGNLILRFLLQNNISTEYISRYTDGKTAVSLAFLDHQQNADYSFYKIFPSERLNIPLPSVQPDDVVLFGSFYALTGSLRSKIMDFVRTAKSSGAYVIYDPNFRQSHVNELDTLRPWILENISLADLVRGSDEDFRTIFNAESAPQAWNAVNLAGCSSLVYTKGGEGVELLTNGFSKSYSVPKIEPVSTIGAGDAFNAGIIYEMLSGESNTKRVEANLQGIADRLISSGIQFSTEVCQSFDNYISPEMGMRLQKTT
jgi:fructokinase